MANIPAEGWYFVEWQGTDCFVASCPLTPRELENDLTLTVIFEPY